MKKQIDELSEAPRKKVRQTAEEKRESKRWTIALNRWLEKHGSVLFGDEGEG